MDTRDRKEKQLTLIEFNEEQQAFNFNEDGQTPPREGWMPVAWMPHDEAARFTKTAKQTIRERRIGVPKKEKITLEEVVQTIYGLMYDSGFDKAMELESTMPHDAYLVCHSCVEGGADIDEAFADELTAYHYMDCEGGDFVEKVTVRKSYENHKRRTYYIEMTQGQTYGDVKDNINTKRTMATDFTEKDVKQAVMWTLDAGRLHLNAYIVASHRYQAFKYAEQIISNYNADTKGCGRWLEYPSYRELTPRRMSGFERRMYDNMFFGTSSDPAKPLRGMMDRFMEEYELYKQQREAKDFYIAATTIDNQSLLHSIDIYRVSDFSEHKRSEVWERLPDETQMAIIEKWMQDLGVWWKAE